MGSPGHTSRDTRDNMIPLDKHNTIMPPSSTVNLTQLKFESANSSESESNMVWIILFSLLIFISVLSNSLYILYNIRRRCVTHTFLSVFFLLSLLDYVLLIIEFSSEHPGQFSHSEAWCSLYQLLLQTAPLLTSVTIVFLIYQAWGLPSLFRTPALLTLIISTTTILLWLLVPSVLFSEIAVYPSTARYCVIDLSGLATRVGLDIHSQHILTALYFILYKSVLSYWVPVLLTLVPLVKMLKLVNTDADKNLKISLSVAVRVSFIIFNFPLAAVTAVRQIILIRSAPMAYNEKYVLDIAESLLKLLSYFYHVFRPLVCLVLEHAASVQSDNEFIINEKFQIEEKKLIPRRGDEEQ